MSSADESRPLLGEKKKRLRRRCHGSCRGGCCCILVLLLIVLLYPALVPFVYESAPLDSTWRNRVYDFRYPDARPGVSRHTPQQLLLSLGSPGRVVVSWVSYGAPVGGPSLVTVHHGTGAPAAFASTPTQFVDILECPSTARLMHAVSVQLPPGASRFNYTVEYAGVSRRVEDAAVRDTGLAREGEGARAMRVAMFGDLGTRSYGVHADNSSIALLESLVQKRALDLVVHIGDIAYNLDDDCGRVGDAFMLDVEAVSSRIPYMLGPGNHEAQKWEMASYRHYLRRYAGQAEAAASSQSLSVRYYSFTQGLAHFVVLDADAFVSPVGFGLAGAQVEWLENDLHSVDRTATPWLVVLLHRALYCTKSPDAECNEESALLRRQLEETFLRHGVDVVVAGHTHHYERTYPVTSGVVASRSYAAPRGIVHMQSGVAGSLSTDAFSVPQQAWEAYRDESYHRGVLVADFHSGTSLTLTQLDTRGDVVDKVTITEASHRPHPVHP
eukprot:Rhum_TRINITY_DN7499_c0_g1::Rhum_TRINITY_DN7499_c0_g1_i1::g.23204::m.23204